MKEVHDPGVDKKSHLKNHNYSNLLHFPTNS